jgi:hypothetical protein
MQEKHKVTLYLPPDLHRNLKIRAAVDAEPMSTIAERAIVFYLTHSDVVAEVEAVHGRVHQVYSCPECTSSLVLQDGEMVILGEQPGLLADEELSVTKVKGGSSTDPQELVPV